jgi:hypothetical protein
MSKPWKGHDMIRVRRLLLPSAFFAFVCGAFAVFLVAQAPLRADLYYEQISWLKPAGSEEQPPSTRMKVYVRSRMVRAEDTGAGKTIITRMDKGVIWGLNEANKTYTEITFKEWQQARQSAGADRDAKSAITVEEAKEEETLCGHPCRKFTLFADGQPVMYLWNAAALDIPEKTDLYDYVKCLGKFPKALLDKARNVPGFPLRVKAIESIGSEKVEIFREITMIRLDPVDPKLFEVPNDFKKVEVETK